MAQQAVYNPAMAYPNMGFENQASNLHNGFGPSLTSPHHPVTSIIGPPKIDPKRLEEDSRYENRLQYPSAYMNQSTYLGEIITGLTTAAGQDQSFLLRLLPPLLTDSMSFTWNRLHFAEGTALVLPEEGVPHVLKFAQSSDFASVERKGIAIRCEANFAYTEMGRTLLLRQVAQVAKACRESQDIDTIFTLMATDGMDYGDQFKRGRINRDWQVMLSAKNAETFCLQKRHGNFEQDVFIKLVDSRKELLSARGATATDLIMCRGAEMYLHGIGQDNSYAVAGPEGPARAKQNMFASVSNYRGLQVNHLKQYILQQNMAPTDFLTGSRVGGEYYVLPKDKTAIKLMDYSKGKRVEISRQTVADKAIKLLMDAGLTGDEDYETEKGDYDKINPLITQNNESKNTGDVTVPGADDNGLDYLICRPFMQFLVGHAIMLEGGSRLGQNFVGTRSNFEWGDNAVDQTKIGTYIFYSKAVIFEKLFVTHIKDIVCKKYLGGGNTNFMTFGEINDIAQNDWVPYSVKDTASLFAIPINNADDLPMHLPLSGYFENDLENGKKLLYSTLEGLREKLNFRTPVSMHNLVNFYDPNISNINNSGLKAHLVVSLGYHELLVTDAAGNRLRWEKVLGDSFLGNDIYDGCEKVLNGIVPTFKNMEHEKNMIIPLTN